MKLTPTPPNSRQETEMDDQNGHDEQQLTLTNQRDALGRFAPGNRLGGRASRAFEQRRLQRLSEKVTDEEWDKIIDTALTQAKDGNWRARQWISDYLMPPRQVVTSLWEAEEQIVKLRFGKGDTKATATTRMPLIRLINANGDDIEDDETIDDDEQ